MTDIILETKNLVKRFGGLVATNTLDYVLPRKMIASIIGPNGAGKTTLFNCLTGFYQPEEGAILFEGESIVGLEPYEIVHQGIARTYQNIRLFNNMTVIENIMVGEEPHLTSSWIGTLFGRPRVRREEAQTEETARELLNFVGLQGKGDLFAKNLPYGDQRRLEIARALAGKPSLILLDEPTAGMNPRETAQTTEFIRTLRDDLGITVLLIEHDMRVVMNISEKVTVLDYGEKIAEGTPEEIQADPRVIEAYLGREAVQAVAQAAA